MLGNCITELGIGWDGDCEAEGIGVFEVMVKDLGMQLKET